ncbi:MAG: DUF427 domain-containing protein [Chloroflexi bacterium]|nr:MAG: DUF427 domain-containing protein [Chloroflexota bacterium]
MTQTTTTTTASRGRVRTEPGHKRVRAYLGGRLVADSRRPLLVWERPYYPTYYLPAGDVPAELVPTGRVEHSPSRGDAEIYDVRIGGVTAAGAARRHPESPLEPLRDAVRLEWGAMDEWFEEDEPVYTHPRDPGVVIAESHQPRVLFETNLPPRYYLPITDVRMELLRPSTTETHCPYKGVATYWTLDTGRGVHPDAVWIYRSPFAESQKIAGLACFYNERVDLYLDGVLQERPRTHFS